MTYRIGHQSHCSPLAFGVVVFKFVAALLTLNGIMNTKTTTFVHCPFNYSSWSCWMTSLPNVLLWPPATSSSSKINVKLSSDLRSPSSDVPICDRHRILLRPSSPSPSVQQPPSTEEDGVLIGSADGGCLVEANVL